MRILEKDLDVTIREKINRLDSLMTNMKDGYLTIKNNEVMIQEINSFNFRKIFTLSELDEILDSKYVSNKYIKSSFDTPMVKDSNVIGDGYESLLTHYDKALIEMLNLDEIIKHKFINQHLIFLTENGKINIYSLETDKVIHKMDIINPLNTLIVNGEITCYDILDFDIVNDSLLISVANSGVYLLNLKTKTVELKFSELNVKFIKVRDNTESIILVTDELVSVYSMETDFKTDKFNMLNKYNQIPTHINSDGRHFFITGLPVGIQSNGNLLHLLKEDINKVSLNNMDHLISPLKNNPNITSTSRDNQFLYLFYKDKDTVSYVRYNTEFVNREPEYGTLNVNGFDTIRVVDDIFYIINDKRLIIMNYDGDIIRNILVSNTIKDVIVSEDKENVYLITNNKLSKFKMNNVKTVNSVTLELIKKGEVKYNDVTVIMESDEDVKFKTIINEKEDNPSFTLKHGKILIIKILNKEVESLEINANSKLNYVLVKNDLVFLR